MCTCCTLFSLSNWGKNPGDISVADNIYHLSLILAGFEMIQREDHDNVTIAVAIIVGSQLKSSLHIHINRLYVC